MFGKAWRWLTARSGKQQGLLRLFVHRHPMYQSFWQPIVTPNKQPGMQIQIYLEASNMAAGCAMYSATLKKALPAPSRKLREERSAPPLLAILATFQVSVPILSVPILNEEYPKQSASERRAISSVGGLCESGDEPVFCDLIPHLSQFFRRIDCQLLPYVVIVERLQLG